MDTLNLIPNAAAAPTPQKRMPVLFLFVFLGLGILVLIAIPVVRFFAWSHSYNLRAFVARGNSICPAICASERFLAGMDAFDSGTPQRGDVILFEHEGSRTWWIKRVIAISGDTVAFGSGATGSETAMLVNGKPVALPPPCGGFVSHPIPAAPGSPLADVKVEDSSLFVIGDNLDHSYDSRQFGTIRVNKVRGKALLIYWSSSASRIGCKIR